MFCVFLLFLTFSPFSSTTKQSSSYAVINLGGKNVPEESWTNHNKDKVTYEIKHHYKESDESSEESESDENEEIKKFLHNIKDKLDSKYSYGYEIKNHNEKEGKSKENKEGKYSFAYEIKNHNENDKENNESKHSYGYNIKNHNEKDENDKENKEKEVHSLKEHDNKQVKYEFEYGVEDYNTKDIKYHKEKRIGDKVEGKYLLYQPDGKVRIVKYNSNKDDGFNADVKYKKFD